MNLSELVSSARASFATLEVEMEKFSKGNKAAGTRVRKAAQEIKVSMQEIRTVVQDSKNAKA